MGDVVDDADGEVIGRRIPLQLVEAARTIDGSNSFEDRP